MVKTSVNSRFILSSWFYAALLGTTSAMPLFLNPTTGDAAAVGAGDAKAEMSFVANTDGVPQAESQVWERCAPARITEESPLDVRTLVEMHRALRFPQRDIPRAGQAMTDKSDPDAAIVRQVKVARAKAIKA